MIDIRTAALGAALLRASLGVLLLAHGLLKVLVFTIPGAVGFFEKVGYPGMLAYLVIAIEVIGGIMMFVGLWTRWVALVAIPVLLGATSVHFANGWMFANANGGWEFPAFWAVALAVQALLGDGAYSVSDAIKSKATARVLAAA